MKKERGILYLLELLARLIEESGRSDRNLEGTLGVSHGWLRLLLKGRIDLKIRHIEAIGGELGFTLEDFFRWAYGTEGALPLKRLEVASSPKSVKDKKGEKTRKQTHLSAGARLEVRDLIHEELAKLREGSEEEDDGGDGEES